MLREKSFPLQILFYFIYIFVVWSDKIVHHHAADGPQLKFMSSESKIFISRSFNIENIIFFLHTEFDIKPQSEVINSTSKDINNISKKIEIARGCEQEELHFIYYF